MNTIAKKWMTGTIAASVILGGGVYGGLMSQAYAASTTISTDTNSTDSSGAVSKDPNVQFKHKDFGGFRGDHNVVQETATLLNVDQPAIETELAAGKTLAQIAQEKAGLTEDLYLQKLVDVENKAIDDALASGKLTQAQADQRKAGLADHLKKEVEQAGQDHGPGGHDGFGPFGNRAAISKIIGITEQELGTQLDAGKSLADIAQTKGINEDTLISSIKDNMTTELKKFVERKDTDTHAPNRAAAAASSASASSTAN